MEFYRTPESTRLQSCLILFLQRRYSTCCCLSKSVCLYKRTSYSVWTRLRRELPTSVPEIEPRSFVASRTDSSLLFITDVDEISGSHGVEDEGRCLLRFCTV